MQVTGMLYGSKLLQFVGFPVSEVLGRLTALELDGAVRRHHDGYVRALRNGQKRA